MIERSEVARAVERARGGDVAAFEVLFRAFNRPVAGYLRARDASDPEGLGNEVFLRVFRHVRTFEGDADDFRAWLFTIAYRVARDDARRRSRRVHTMPATPSSEPVGGDVESDVMAQLAHERVHDLFQRLSPDQRDVLALRIVSDLSVEDTATVLGKSYEAVKALQRRGLAALRRTISLQEGVPR